MNIDVKDLDINRAYREVKLIRDLAPSAANTYGKFSTTYKLKGELKKDMTPKLETLAGGGVMRIAEAKINGMKMFDEISKAAKKNEINDPHLKDFTMETEIRDNKIIVKPFSIKVSGFDTDIEGVNTMSGMVNYLVKIELIPFTKIKIPFHVTGKYDNPKVALGKGHTLPY
jgi:AsmA protein